MCCYLNVQFQGQRVKSAPVRTQAAIPFCIIRLTKVGIFAGRSWVCSCIHLNFCRGTVETKNVLTFFVGHSSFIYVYFRVTFEVPLGRTNNLNGTGSPFRNSTNAVGWSWEASWIQCRWVWLNPYDLYYSCRTVTHKANITSEVWL